MRFRITGLVFIWGLACFPAWAYNGANAYLLSVSPQEQAAQLAKSVGEGCVGKRAFDMGMATTGSAKDKGFWSVQCTNGKKYVVEVDPDGDGKVMPCSVYEMIGKSQGMRCFKKLEGIH